MSIGNIIKEIRETKGWSVARLERKAGVSREVIYRLERKQGGQIETYERLLRAMGYKLTIEPEPMWKFTK